MSLENDIEMMIKDMTENYRNDPKLNYSTTNLMGKNQYIDNAVQHTISKFVEEGHDEERVNDIAYTVGANLKKEYFGIDSRD